MIDEEQGTSSIDDRPGFEAKKGGEKGGKDEEEMRCTGMTNSE